MAMAAVTVATRRQATPATTAVILVTILSVMGATDPTAPLLIMDMDITKF